MRITRAFKNGNSQAVRIPADLAFERTEMELEIERQGDELRIRPARRSLAGVLSKFAPFSPDFMANGRGDQEQERDHLDSLIQDIPVAPFAAAAGRASASIRLATRDSRKEALDKLSAAHARSLNVTLVTNKTQDFARYPGVMIENWPI